MIRTVLVVALAVALLAASLPAIDVARVERSDAEIRDELERVASEARALYEGNDAPAVDGESARRIVTIRLPTSGVGSAGTNLVRISAPRVGHRQPTARSSSDPTGLSWRVEGGSNHTVRADGVPLRSPDTDSLALETGGRHDLVLSLVSTRGERVVVVEEQTD